MVISSWQHKHLFPLPTTALIRHCPLFRGVGVPCVWYAGHGRREATSDRLIASAERPVTIILLTIGLSVTGKKPVSANRFRKINGFNIPSFRSLNDKCTKSLLSREVPGMGEYDSDKGGVSMVPYSKVNNWK